MAGALQGTALQCAGDLVGWGKGDRRRLEKLKAPRQHLRRKPQPPFVLTVMRGVGIMPPVLFTINEIRMVNEKIRHCCFAGAFCPVGQYL